MRKRLIILAIEIIIIPVLLLFPGCKTVQKVFQNPRYTYENGAVLVGGDDNPILLKNNSQAVDITFSELLDFIRQDGTDQFLYVARGSKTGTTPFVCSDFAELLHNNAESAGIKAAFLSVDFTDGSVGHAINAFQTTDQGQVFIDCTGQSIYSQFEEGEYSYVSNSWDKVAYIEIGQKYGIVNLYEALSPNFEFYLEYDQKWQEYKSILSAYNSEVKRYNQEITGKVYLKGSPEIIRIQEWESQLIAREKALETLRQEIGSSRFKPLGIVKSKVIHW